MGGLDAVCEQDAKRPIDVPGGAGSVLAPRTAGDTVSRTRR